MENSSDIKDKPEYSPPTREAVVQNVYSDGIYVAKCRKCYAKIRGRNLEELRQHKCNG